MQIDTKPYGTIEIDERQVIDFPKGILGFEDLKKFALLDSQQEPFYWLQSMDDKSIAFVLIQPFIFKPEYTPDPVESELVDAKITNIKSDNILIFTIVTIPEDHTKMTANLQGPILINRDEKLGIQIISTNPRWRVKHFILDELSKKEEEAC